jgi:hypothetical protein
MQLSAGKDVRNEGECERISNATHTEGEQVIEKTELRNNANIHITNKINVDYNMFILNIALLRLCDFSTPVDRYI